jgi:predicted ATP-dependent serine protease
VGLLGEIRAVEGQKSILKGLENLWFKNIISSENLSNIKELKDIIFKN